MQTGDCVPCGCECLSRRKRKSVDTNAQSRSLDQADSVPKKLSLDDGREFENNYRM